MASREEVLAAVRAVLERRDEVLDAYVFGSWARGEDQPHSDLDVAVYLDPAARARSALGFDAEIAAELMRALRSDRVDVVLLRWPMLHPFFEGIRDELGIVCQVESQLLAVGADARLSVRYVFRASVG